MEGKVLTIITRSMRNWGLVLRVDCISLSLLSLCYPSMVIEVDPCTIGPPSSPELPTVGLNLCARLLQ